jgi:hypothetical protein
LLLYHCETKCDGMDPKLSNPTLDNQVINS